MKSLQGPPSREESLQEQLKFHKRLSRITHKIHSADGTNDILLNMQEEILSLFDADRITIYAVDVTGKEIVSRFKTGSETGEIRVPIDNESLAGYCAASRKLLNVRDVYDEGELQQTHPELRFARLWDLKSGYRTKQVLVAPIVCNKSLMGVIQLINKINGDRFTKEDRSSIQEIANVLGVAFFNHQKVRKSEGTPFDYLVVHNIVSGKELTEAIVRARTAKKPVESVLMQEYQVSKSDIGKALSAFFKVRFIPYHRGMTIPGNLRKGLKPDYLKRSLFVPVGQSGEKVVVAMGDPNDLTGRDAVKRILPSRRFEFVVSIREDILKMIDLLFEENGPGRTAKSGSPQESVRPGEEEFGRVSGEDNAVVRLVNKMIVDAYHRGASDIHIEPRQGRAEATIRFRVDGACQPYLTVPHSYKRGIVSRLKIMSDLDISERRLPQDGKIRFRRFSPLDIELRVATIPTAGENEDVVLRLLSTGEPIALEGMGMRERDYAAFIEMISKPYGLVLVVGPTGSGKTTTLHAALAHVNRPETKIWTAEDPVEITQEGLRQVQVKPKIGLNFATAMRAFLRADPDVIMVGEMRDRETAAIGIEASLTGHLVLSTLHTNSASETIIRLLDMGMDPFNFADAFLGVLAQRLVRTLCSQCKERYRPSRDQFESLARAHGSDSGSLRIGFEGEPALYRAAGCPACGNTGYLGRTSLQELLVGTESIKALIQNRARVEEVRAQAVREGMATLMQDGIRKVLEGQTDLAQVRKVCMR